MNSPIYWGAFQLKLMDFVAFDEVNLVENCLGVSSLLH